MGKQKAAKSDLPTTPQFKVELVGGQISPPPPIDKILDANEGYFKWINNTQGAAEAEKARNKMRASLELAQRVTDAQADELQSSKNIVRLTAAD